MSMELADPNGFYPRIVDKVSTPGTIQSNRP